MNKLLLLFCITLASGTLAFASGGAGTEIDTAGLTGSFFGILSVFLFVAAYSLVILEEQLHLRKSKPVLLAAGIIWILVAITFSSLGNTHAAEDSHSP